MMRRRRDSVMRDGAEINTADVESFISRLGPGLDRNEFKTKTHPATSRTIRNRRDASAPERLAANRGAEPQTRKEDGRSRGFHY